MGEIFQDRDAVIEAYNDVRKDDSATNWFVYIFLYTFNNNFYENY